MKTEIVTASSRERKGKPLEKDGKVVTRVLKKPETMSEIEAAFGSMENLVNCAIAHKRVLLQNEIRLEVLGNGSKPSSDGYKFRG